MQTPTQPPELPEEDLELMNNCVVRSSLAVVLGGGLGLMVGMLFGTTGYDPVADAKKTTWVQVKDTYKAAGKNSIRMAKNFSAVGGLFAGTECLVEKYRGRSDLKNGIYAGCATGAALSAKAGPKASCIGCAGFAAFSIVMDTFTGRHG